MRKPDLFPPDAGKGPLTRAGRVCYIPADGIVRPCRGEPQIADDDSLTPDALADLLRTETLGRDIHCLDETTSTNDVARRLAQEGAQDGTIVLAETQTAGRGRQHRKWFSPRGAGVYMSIVLRSPFHVRHPEALSLLGAFTTATAIRAETGLLAQVKWPNDVILQKKKVAGVLGESGQKAGSRFVILGIGVNVNAERKDFPAEISRTATSLRAECGRAISRRHLIASLLARFEEFYLRSGSDVLADLVTAIKPLCPILNQTVSMKREKEIVRGRALDIDETGALVVETAHGERRTFVAGEVTLL